MPISDNDKLDFLWKKVAFGVASTSAEKNDIEESARSQLLLMASNIWRQDSAIPKPASALTGIVEFVDIQLVRDPTVPTNTTWLALHDPMAGFGPSNRMGDFIPFSVDPSYEVKVYSDSARTQRVLPNTDELSWVFDYASGTLKFNGVISSEAMPSLFLRGYRYVGLKGVAVGNGDGASTVLEEPTEGSYAGGYVKGWTPYVTTISDAFQTINEALLDFLPEGAPSLNMQHMTIPGGKDAINGRPVLLATGFTDSSGVMADKPVPGDRVLKVPNGIPLETNVFGPYSPGNTGTITVQHNGTIIGSRALTVGNDEGTYGALVILQDGPWPENAQYTHNEAITSKVSNFVAAGGLNGLVVNHSGNGATNTVWFVNDNISVKPTVSALEVFEDQNYKNLNFSSGIPHYNEGSRLNVSADVKDLATNVYFSAQNVEVKTTPVNTGPTVWAMPTTNGLPAILEKGETYQVTNVPFNIDSVGNEQYAFGTVAVEFTARNANGETILQGPRNINVKRGMKTSGISPIDEVMVPIERLGDMVAGAPLYAQRIKMPIGVAPEWPYGVGLPPLWDSAEETESHEASVVGGVLRFEGVDYTTWFPVGPDYSDKEPIQYATFMIRRSNVSQMIIQVRGTYSGIQVKLPGIQDLPLVQNGWWDAGKMYHGFGTPGLDVPDGISLGEPGLGGGQDIHVTFGRENSSNAYNNIILVRFKLQAGDAITGIGFRGVD